MKFILNSNLTAPHPVSPPTERDLERFVGTLGSNIGGKHLYTDFPAELEKAHHGFVGLLSTAYSNHEKIAIAPHDLWFIFLTELAKIVNSNSAVCKPLFTRAEGDEKIRILVPTADITKIDANAVMDVLHGLVPTDVNMFIPQLSTSTPEVKMAMSATFADMVQSYYSYETMMCGIPEVKITGTFADWRAMVVACSNLASTFAGIGLIEVMEYVLRVGDIFVTIAAHKGDYLTAQPESPEDWHRGIFTSKNIGSGSELQIDGWITQLFFKQHPINKLANFTSTYGVIPYVNTETGRQFKSAHGAFAQLRDDEGFIYAGYTQSVYEVLS